MNGWSVWLIDYKYGLLRYNKDTNFIYNGIFSREQKDSENNL